MKRIFLFVVMLALIPVTGLSSTQVTLKWSANTESDLAGYKVFCREEDQPYNYINPAWETTETTCTIYDLDEFKTYYFVVRAFDIEEFESSDSNEVCFEPPPVENFDTVNITSVKYDTKKSVLTVQATSDSTSTVILTVWATYGSTTVELGNLKYSSRKKIYYNSFRKLSAQPDEITVTSTGGGIGIY